MSTEVDTAKALRLCMFNAGEMSSKTLADRYGCTKSNISFMRKEGVRNLDAIEKLCEVFEIKVSDFMKLGED